MQFNCNFSPLDLKGSLLTKKKYHSLKIKPSLARKTWFFIGFFTNWESMNWKPFFHSLPLSLAHTHFILYNSLDRNDRKSFVWKHWNDLHRLRSGCAKIKRGRIYFNLKKLKFEKKIFLYTQKTLLIRQLIFFIKMMDLLLKN